MNRDWTDVWGGDGFFNKFDPSDSNILYSESQGGNAGWVNMTTGETRSFRPVARPTDARPDRSYRFNWNAPIAPSRHHPGWVYVGGNHVMRSKDRGAHWEEISPDLTKRIDRDTLEIMGAHVTSRTLSANDGTSSYGTITVIEESPLSDQVLYVGTDDGNLQVTQDGGASWTNVAPNVTGLPGRSTVSRIEASHAVEGRVYATFDRHYDDDYRPYVFASEDYGASWKPIAAGLPEWSVNVVREHPSEPNLLFVGDEIGIFVSTDRGGSWHRMANLPTVKVNDIAVHPRDNDLVVATHGRSIWIMDDLNPLEGMAKGPVLDEDATLFPPAQATEWFRPGGWPFWGDAFQGENEPDGSMLRYWVKSAPAAEAKATLTVRAASGEVVRVLEGPATPGLHQVVWDMREKAPVEVQGGQGEQGGRGGSGGGFRGGSIQGPLVMPGTYLVTLSAGDVTAEQAASVRLDPRVRADVAALQARHDAVASAAAINATTRNAQAAIRRLRTQIAEAKQLLGAEGDPSLSQAADTLTAQLDTLNARLGRAGPGRAASGLESSASAPSDDEAWAIDRAWREVPPLVQELNDLIATRVPAFNRRLDQAGVRPSPGKPVAIPKRPGGR
jgi:hypothetical protein